MKKTLYKTIIQYEILSEDPINENQSLDDIAYQTTEGSWSGRFLPTVTFNEPISGIEAVNAVKAQGSDPDFFFMDNEGNNIDN